MARCEWATEAPGRRGVAPLLIAMVLLTAFAAVCTGLADEEDFDPQSASLSELNRRCEDAREKKIAPLRDAEIARCKADKRNDPGYCERFFASYGDASYAANGTYVPRMFNDLPECVVADQERKRRTRIGE